MFQKGTSFLPSAWIIRRTCVSHPACEITVSGHVVFLGMPVCGSGLPRARRTATSPLAAFAQHSVLPYEPKNAQSVTEFLWTVTRVSRGALGRGALAEADGSRVGVTQTEFSAVSLKGQRPKNSSSPGLSCSLLPGQVEEHEKEPWLHSSVSLQPRGSRSAFLSPPFPDLTTPSACQCFLGHPSGSLVGVSLFQDFRGKTYPGLAGAQHVGLTQPGAMTVRCGISAQLWRCSLR